MQCVGKAWNSAGALGFNHSPPPRRALQFFTLSRLILGIAPAVVTGKASERKKAAADKAKALLECSQGNDSCPVTPTAWASNASERTKGCTSQAESGEMLGAKL